jgi:NAD(P)-dependent dehydrogenase (short-subunit alcohol dehydrogenase family)
MKLLMSEAQRREYGAKLVPGRMIQPMEVAQAIAFLGSDLASGCNGATLHVCGGECMP